ncbi:acyl carrier protein [Tianweitania sediminis]|jgi:nodulation protein F|uniref:Acyl carrier protein n=1 Tax=Tianweitania sediminis TaxID=1502156 RepID=A0A8J7UFN0_9HYPH|nr:acyl carrier protein [Tianweitania sediminis]MBP0437284.1 acyl carrier protein [Tianweitania sediminis]HEV7417537.1 acyl carrier protein [Tianweitania sediminis]
MADALANDIIAKIERHGELEPGSVTLDSELTTLGIHSLELTEIIFDIEDEHGIHVEMNTAEAWGNLRTVGDIVEAVRELIKAKG